MSGLKQQTPQQQQQQQMQMQQKEKPFPGDYAELLSWAGKDYTLQTFVEKWKNRLPALIKTTSGFSGYDGNLHEVGADEVFWIFDIQEQERVVAKASGDRYVSIPVDYPLNFQIVLGADGRSLKLGPPMPMSEIASDRSEIEDEKVVFETNPKFAYHFGATTAAVTECAGNKFGVLELIDTYTEKYLLAHSFLEDSVDPAVVGIPAYLPISVDVLKVKEGNEQFYKDFCKKHSKPKTNNPRPQEKRIQPCNDILLFDEQPSGDYEYIHPSMYLRQSIQSETPTSPTSPPSSPPPSPFKYTNTPSYSSSLEIPVRARHLSAVAPRHVQRAEEGRVRVRSSTNPLEGFEHDISADKKSRMGLPRDSQLSSSLPAMTTSKSPPSDSPNSPANLSDGGAENVKGSASGKAHVRPPPVLPKPLKIPGTVSPTSCKSGISVHGAAVVSLHGENLYYDYEQSGQGMRLGNASGDLCPSLSPPPYLPPLPPIKSAIEITSNKSLQGHSVVQQLQQQQQQKLQQHLSPLSEKQRSQQQEQQQQQGQHQQQPRQQQQVSSVDRAYLEPWMPTKPQQPQMLQQQPKRPMKPLPGKPMIRTRPAPVSVLYGQQRPSTSRLNPNNSVSYERSTLERLPGTNFIPPTTQGTVLSACPPDSPGSRTCQPVPQSLRGSPTSPGSPASRTSELSKSTRQHHRLRSAKPLPPLPPRSTPPPLAATQPRRPPHKYLDQMISGEKVVILEGEADDNDGDVVCDGPMRRSGSLDSVVDVHLSSLEEREPVTPTPQFTARLRQVMKEESEQKRGGACGGVVGGACDEVVRNQEERWKTLAEIPTDMSQLGISQVCLCLELLGMRSYVPSFRDALIDGSLLMSLTEELLTSDLFIRKLDAIKIMRFARDGWRPKM